MTTVTGGGVGRAVTAGLSGITMVGDPRRRAAICQRYAGNDTGAEPVKLRLRPGCDYTAADIAYRDDDRRGGAP